METEKTFQSAQAGGQTEGAEVPTCGVASGADELLPSSRVHSTSVVPLTKACEATASVPAQQQVLSCRSCARSASWTGNTCSLVKEIHRYLYIQYAGQMRPCTLGVKAPNHSALKRHKEACMTCATLQGRFCRILLRLKA